MQHLIETFGSEYDIKRYAYADDLKSEVYDALLDMLDPYWAVAPFNSLVLSHPLGACYIDTELDNKVRWCDAHRQEIRPVLQHYGTEYRRAQSPFYWVNKTA